MKNQRTLAIAAGIIMLLAGCNLVESPLSDVPVSDPSLLQIVASADRQVSADGYYSYDLRVFLYDKHGYYVKVEGGGVTVNGQLMNDSYFGSYARTDLAVGASLYYTFTVKMSDGSKQSCRVKTPADLRSVSLPSSYGLSGPITISWINGDTELPTTVKFDGDTVHTSFTAPAGRSSLTLAAADFAGFHRGQSVRVTVQMTRTGQVEGGFMSTSRVTSTFSIERKLQL